MTSDSVRYAWVTATSPQISPAISCAVRGCSRMRPRILRLAAVVAPEALVDERDGVGDRIAVAGEHEGHVLHRLRALHRREVDLQRMRALRVRPLSERPRDERVGGDVADEVVGGDQDPARAVVQDDVGRRVAGPVVHVQLAVAQPQDRAFVQRARDVHRAAPAAERRRDAAQREAHVVGDPVLAHDLRREDVVLLDRLAVVAEPRRQGAERRDLRAGTLREQAGEPRVVEVLVGEDDELEVLEPVPEAREPAFQHVQRPRGVRADVDERQRRVLDEPAVDAPDRERRRDRDAMDAGLGRPGVEILCVDVLGQERISPSTSSRRRSMSSGETSDSSVRRSSGSVFDARTLKCQSS